MKLHYKELGKGQPVIILHGLFGMLDNWMTAAKKLAEDFHVYLPDLRNHGRSPHSDEFNYEVLASDLKEFIEARDMRVADVIGHSMGGKAAMQLALDYPGVVGRLVVVDMTPREYPPNHSEIIEALLDTKPRNAASRSEIQEFLMSRLHVQGVVAFLMKNLARQPEGGYKWRMNLPVLSDRYDDIRAAVTSEDTFIKPALFIRGEQSSYVKDEDVSQIRKLFPNAELRTIAGAGHWVHADRPDEIVKVIRKFLS
jgi:esterase